jgi:hypothetical protein
VNPIICGKKSKLQVLYIGFSILLNWRRIQTNKEGGSFPKEKKQHNSPTIFYCARASKRDLSPSHSLTHTLLLSPKRELFAISMGRVTGISISTSSSIHPIFLLLFHLFLSLYPLPSLSGKLAFSLSLNSPLPLSSFLHFDSVVRFNSSK